MERAVGGSGGQVDDRRGWLIEQRCRLDAGEAAWLAELARFDASGAWATDGQLSATGWLVVFCRMSRATAFDKVRVARQLALRPQVAAALDEGRISYSAARAITRAEDPSPDVDEALVAVAESATVADVERVVRTYHAYRDQDRPLDERIERRRGIRFFPTGDGLVRIEGHLTELEAAELRSVLELLIEVEDRREYSAEDPAEPAPAEPAAAEPAAAPAPAPAPAQSSAEDPVSPQHRAGRRADALVDLARIAGGALRRGVEGGGHGHGHGHGGGADRYTTHVITLADGRSTSLNGTPQPQSDAERIACDSGIVHHRYSAAGEPLALGRRSRSWSLAQQRAARVRDGGHCRFPGCGRLVVDLHHLRWWEDGGSTDIDNGLLLCTRHHTLVHEGVFTISGRANDALTFFLPSEEVIGVTCPRIGALLQPGLVPAS